MATVQNQTSTTQKTVGGVTTTTTVTTTPVIQSSNQNVASASITTGSVEKEIERHNKLKATNVNNKSLKEILETVSTTPTNDELSFGSTSNIATLPHQVRSVLIAEGISLNEGDRIIHTPGALFFSLVQNTPEGKKYSSYSLYKKKSEIVDNEFDDEDFLDDIESENNQEDAHTNGVAVSNQMTVDINKKNSVITQETSPGQIEIHQASSHISEVAPLGLVTDSSVLQKSQSNENTELRVNESKIDNEIVGIKEPLVGTLGTIGFSSVKPKEKNVSPEVLSDNEIFAIHGSSQAVTSESASDQVSELASTTLPQVSSSAQNISTVLPNENTELKIQSEQEAVVGSNIEIVQTTSPEQTTDPTFTQDLKPEISLESIPQSWQFEQEIIHGPKVVVTLDDRIKEAADFIQLNAIITEKPEFAQEPSQDVWMLVRNYMHGLISLDRIPRNFGLQQKVDRLKKIFDQERELLEFVKNKEQTDKQSPENKQSEMLMDLIARTTDTSVNNQNRSVLESLGFTSLIPDIQVPTNELPNIMQVPEQVVSSISEITNDQVLDTTSTEVFNQDRENGNSFKVVSNNVNIEPNQGQENIRNVIYQLFEQKLFQVFGISQSI